MIALGYKRLLENPSWEGMRAMPRAAVESGLTFAGFLVLSGDANPGGPGGPPGPLASRLHSIGFLPTSYWMRMGSNE